MKTENYSFYIKLTVFFSGLFFILFAFTSSNFFFWDTIVQASRNADFFYQTGFSSLLVPDRYDAGHPPLFGMYLAFVWKIFGRSLQVSHWAMFPFIVGIIYQSIKLIGKFTEKKNIVFVLLLMLVDATFLSQSILVSPDIIMLFTFLFALHAILERNNSGLMIALIVQSLVNTRGIIFTAIIFLFDIFFYTKPFSFREIIKRTWIYLPAALFVVAYYTHHYIEKGWFISYAGSEYEGGRKLVDLQGALFNIFVFIWRWIDFGRVFVWITLGLIIIFSFRKLGLLQKNLKPLTSILILFFCFTLLFFIPISNSIGHRYMLPGYFLLAMIIGISLTEVVKSVKYRSLVFLLLILACLSGNWWKYPEGIAMGWDSTMGHIPYYSLRSEAFQYMDEHHIAFEETGSAFPAIDYISVTDLTNDHRKLADKNLEQNHYILYSNVFNDFTNSETDSLKCCWEVEKSFKKGIIELIIYKRLR